MSGERTFHFVRHHDIPAWEALGWANTRCLIGCHHGEWSDMLEWKGEGEPAFPLAEGGMVGGS